MEWLTADVVKAFVNTTLGIGVIIYSLTLAYSSRKEGGGETSPSVEILLEKVSALEGWMHTVDGRVKRIEDILMNWRER